MRPGRHRVVVLVADSRAGPRSRRGSCMPRLSKSLPSLGPGDKGTAVSELQERLFSLGFDVVRNGYYDEDRARGDGVREAGRPTHGRSGRAAPPGGRCPPPPRAAAHRHAGAGSRSTRPISSSSSSARQGAAHRGHLDRAGGVAHRRRSFALYNHFSGWRRSDLGLLWNPYYFDGGRAVHGAFYVPPTLPPMGA